jgi:hypothetical protein
VGASCALNNPGGVMKRYTAEQIDYVCKQIQIVYKFLLRPVAYDRKKGVRLACHSEDLSDECARKLKRMIHILKLGRENETD